MEMNIIMLPVSKVTSWKLNPRNISKEAVNAVAKSIFKHGFNQPIVINQDFVCCVGHVRLLAAHKLNLKKIPVYQKNMTEKQFQTYAMADNKSHEFTTWNFDSLSEIFAGIDKEIFKDTLFSQSDIKLITEKNDIGNIEENNEKENEEENHEKENDLPIGKETRLLNLYYSDEDFHRILELIGVAGKDTNVEGNISQTVLSVFESHYGNTKS